MRSDEVRIVEMPSKPRRKPSRVRRDERRAVQRLTKARAKLNDPNTSPAEACRLRAAIAQICSERPLVAEYEGRTSDLEHPLKIRLGDGHWKSRIHR